MNTEMTNALNQYHSKYLVEKKSEGYSIKNRRSGKPVTEESILKDIKDWLGDLSFRQSLDAMETLAENSYIKEQEDSERRSEQEGRVDELLKDFNIKLEEILSRCVVCSYTDSTVPQMRVYPKKLKSLKANPDSMKFGPSFDPKELKAALCSVYHHDMVELQRMHIQCKKAASTIENPTKRKAVTSLLQDSLEKMFSSTNNGPKLIEENMDIICEQPETISDDPTKPHHLHFDKKTLCKGLYPTWNEFLGKFKTPDSSKKVFMLWVGGLFSNFRGCRQALWIWGEGGDGKSAACRVIKSHLGTAGFQLGSLKSDHALIGVDAARLVLIEDCDNPKVLLNAKVKQLTGGNTIRLNPKGQSEYEVRGDWRVLINSNKMPDIDMGDMAQSSRLLLLQIDPNKNREKSHIINGQLAGDGTFETRLMEEFSHFLYDCIELFEEEILNHPTKIQNIPIPKDLEEEHKNDVGSSQNEYINDFINEALIINLDDEDMFTATTELEKEFRQYWKNNHLPGGDFAVAEFRKQLKKRGCVSYRPSAGSRLRGYKFVETISNAGNPTSNLNLGDDDLGEL